MAGLVSWLHLRGPSRPCNHDGGRVEGVRPHDFAYDTVSIGLLACHGSQNLEDAGGLVDTEEHIGIKSSAVIGPLVDVIGLVRGRLHQPHVDTTASLAPEQFRLFLWLRPSRDLLFP